MPVVVVVRVVMPLRVVTSVSGSGGCSGGL